MIKYRSIELGCDPEFFFEKDGKIIGAEKVLPADGLHALDTSGIYRGKIIIDGIQAELNPVQDTCRELVAYRIHLAFKSLRQLMEDKGVRCNFSPTVEVTQDEMDSLSDGSKQFGCAPSKNTGGESKIAITDASKYMKRSAGGHLHFGGRNDAEVMAVLRNPEVLVPILDIIVGNTCVLLDRDSGNIERRKVYGKAGEYRTPSHGLEYRTLSNFWLKDYVVLSFVFGIARQAILAVADGHAKEFMDAVNMKDVVNAINNNDYELALKNFNKMVKVLVKITPDYQEAYPLGKDNLKQFRHFFEKGLDYWFKGDIFTNWVYDTKYVGKRGISNFLSTVVNEDIKKHGTN